MAANAAPQAEAPAHVQVSRLMDGYLVTQLLYVAAQLGLADALAGAAAELPIHWPDKWREPGVLGRCCGGEPPMGCWTSTPTGASV